MFGQQPDDQPMDAAAPATNDQAMAVDTTLPGDQQATPVDATSSAPMTGYGNDAGYGVPPQATDDAAAATPAPLDEPAAPAALPASDDLLDIKQQALQQLTPLVGHLDQTPEEKFRTTMMMIQASDNADLIKDAYAAAEQITDEKAKAQALLDIVNEINYFTSHQNQ